jgi:hypothetical protein
MANGSVDVPQPEETKFTKALWIVLHQSLTFKFKTYEIDSKVLGQSDPFKDARKIGEELAKSSPANFSSKARGWFELHDLFDGDYSDEKADLNVIASWKASRGDLADQIFTFPDGSPHSSHTITMKRVKVWNRSETFVNDSVEYQWRFDSPLSRSRFTLYKIFGGQEVVVAKYKGPLPVFRPKGALLVNEKEIDFVVALLSCCGVIRKDRQRK